jgi:S-adenosylmethionine-dependent methyltransferase
VSPELVELWLGALPLGVISRSGIRVFHDYIFDEANRNREPENLIALELQYSRQQPFLSLGRYIHVLATKN